MTNHPSKFPTQPEMVKVEFHCHTCYSKDSLLKIQDLLIACHRKGIQRLVVTDHNTIEGAVQAVSIDPQRFIIGEEIMTLQGELIGLFVKEYIPAGLPAKKTIEILRAQGAFISVSHPFDTFRSGHWESADLLEIVDSVDAIEVFNSRCLRSQFNARAKEFCQRHNLHETVGSDAHYSAEIGAATLTLPNFDSADSLKKALMLSEPHLRLSPPWVHFYSRYAAWWKKLAA